MSDPLVTLERKAALSQATPQRRKTLRAAAEAISLANVDAATCELLSEALARLVVIAYQEDAGGMCNVDVITGRLLIPLPWGRNGYAKWGLRPQEANILRQVLFDWQEDAPALLRYDRMRRSWFVDLYYYGDLSLAKRWLAKHQIDVRTYRSARAKRLAG